MKKPRLYVGIILMTLGLYVNAQDIIITNVNDSINAKVIEINTNEIKYKNTNNLNGPIYTILKTDVFKITYYNGTIDVFNNNTVILDDNFLRLSRENPLMLLKKGNNAFIEILDSDSRAGERYFKDALREWGYWNIVDNVKDAQFIINFNIDKAAFLDKRGNVTFKTRGNVEFKKSKSYKGATSAFTGYNAFRAVAIKIVDKYFKKEFK